jgi:iron complex transport system substrate-binding protein
MRIAVFPASLAEIVKLLGEEKGVVGINEEVKLDYCLPELRDRPVIGRYLKRSKRTHWKTLEDVKPDIILDFRVENLHSSGELEAFAKRLGAKTLLLDFLTVEDIVEGSRRISEAIGGDFFQLSQFCEKYLSEISEIGSSIEKKPKVTMIYRGINVVTGTNVISNAIEKAHTENLGKRLRTKRKVHPLKREEFIRRFHDSDHLFLLTSVLTTEEKLKEIRDGMIDSSKWRKIKAVDEGQVHIVGSALDRESFMRWSPRIIPGIYQIGRFVHGRAFPHWQTAAKELYSLCGVDK